MALLKKPYEISVWEDKIKYVGKNSNNETIETFNISDLTSVEYQYYTEQRLATIGSHTMTSPTRALEPTLTRNINGTETLKFEMYYQYIDPNTGERVHNPIIDYLVNERKIKLYLDDYDPNHPDKWYDFIIKKDEEKARDNKYNFTCNSLAAHELGKTGFKLEFDTELENNMGTVQELGKKVLKDSDWQLDIDNSDIIKQTVNEPLYQIYLNTEITANLIQNPDTTKFISAGEKIYVYYTPYMNKEKDYFQFIYIEDESKIQLLSDRMTLICDDTYVYDLYLTNVQWDDDKPSFEDGESVVANYRGDRYVRKQLTAYDSTLKKTVNVYTDNSNPARTVYGYQTTKYYGVNAVQNYVHNSINFGGTSYWYGFGTGTSLEKVTYPAASAGADVERTNYLSIKIGPPDNNQIDYVNNPRIMNDGIIYNYSKIKSFDKNDTYLLRMKVKKMENGVLSNVTATNFPFTCQVRKYTKIDQNTGERCFNFQGSTAIDDEDNFVLITAQCETSASVEELKNNIGIFFFRSNNYGELGENDSYYIEEVQLTEGIWQDDHWLKIDEVPIVKFTTISHYYYPDENKNKTSADNYTYIVEEENGTDVFTPVYGEGNHSFEKIRSITAKETNRFNLLQQLCETFECWIKFNITHEASGRISIENYKYYEILEPISTEDLAATFENGGIDTETGGNTDYQADYRLRSEYIDIRGKQGKIYRIISNFDKFRIFYYTGQGDQDYHNEFSIKQSGQIFKIPSHGGNEYEYIRILFYNNINQTITENDLIYEVYEIPNTALKYNNLTDEYITITNEDIRQDKPNKIYYIEKQRKRQNKRVIFYGEILEDNPIGFKYGINLKDVTRTLDGNQIATKIIVKNNTNEYANNGFCSIARAKDNPTKENFLYNFDYYIKQGILDQSSLNNDLYLKDVAGSIGLYPTLAELNGQRNEIISVYTELANDLMETKSNVEEYTVIYNSAKKELANLTDSVSGKLVRYTGYIYDDFGDQMARAENAENHKINAYNNQIYYAPNSLNNITINAYNVANDWLSVTYYEQIDFSRMSILTGIQIKTEHIEDISGNNFKGSNALKYCLINSNSQYSRCQPNEVIKDNESYIYLGKVNKICYIKGSSNTFVENEKYIILNNGTTYFWCYSQNDSGLNKSKCNYFQTSNSTAKIKLEKTNNNQTCSKIYIYGAYRRIGVASPDDTVNDTSTINYIEQINTLQKQKKEAEEKLEYYKGLLISEQEEYDRYIAKLEDIARATEEIEKQFLIKYARYIQEGSWTDDNYMDDDLYYLDAVQVLYQSAYPKVSYTISVLDLSALEDYEPYKFQIAHRTFIEDTEFFGWEDKARHIPARERIVVTELTTNLDQPDKNSIKVQNYRNHFEDLFQRITAATQNLEYHSGDYRRAADAIKPDGEIESSIMEKTMATAQFVIQNADNQSVVIDATGLKATKTDDPAEQVRLTSGGLLVSADGGRNWGVAITGYGISTEYLRAGIIDADKINIYNGTYPTFRWDAQGIRALAYTLDSQNKLTSYNTSNYVTFDRFGVYGINGIVDFSPNSITEVERKANFALTWNGLFIRSTYRNGYVSISPNDDITLCSFGNQSFNSIGTADSLDNIYYLDNRSVFYYEENGEYIKCTTESLKDLGNKTLYISGYKLIETPQLLTSSNYYLYGGNFISCNGDETEQITNNKIYIIDSEGSNGKTAIRRAKFGMIGTDNENSELYGIALYDMEGNPTLTTQSDGTLWLQDSMKIGKANQTNTIYIGVGEDEYIDGQPTGRYKVIKVNDSGDNENFIVYSDGTLIARNSQITGEIIATSGIIGGAQITDNGIIVRNGGFEIWVDKDNEPTRVFYIQDNELKLKGNGEFTGTIYATNGEFSGTIYAESGTIGGFRITENTIESDNLVLKSANGNIESSIYVNNITLGSGANIEEYLDIGNLSLVNPKDDNEGTVLELKDLNDSNNPYFKLTNSGNIYGKNWNIITENGQTIANFDNGNFTGHIEATSGNFTGTISASTIEAAKIITADFITEKVRCMGGAFIFKPTFEIQQNSIVYDESNNITTFTLATKDYNEYFKNLDVINNNIIIGLSDGDGNPQETKIIEKDDNNYTISISGRLDENFLPNIVILFGQTGKDVIIGINSDENTAPNLLKSKSLVIEGFEYLNNSVTTNVKLLLGDLSGVTNESYEGYGLYADNVYLHGSLITGIGTTSNKTYAGINTIPEIESEHFSNEKIVIWAGAIDDEDIENSPFYVTNKGSLYASQGIFEGSVISDSLIARSTIQAAIIEGTGNSPSLKIYDTGNGGISFYKKVNNIDNSNNNEINDIETLRISNDGIYCYSYQGINNPIISFSEENNSIIFKPTNINFSSTEFSNQLIKDTNKLELQIGNNSYMVLDNDKIENKSNNINNITNLLSYELINKNGINNSKIVYRAQNNFYCLFVE